MPDVSPEFRAVLASRSSDLVPVCEIYSYDTLPTEDGFDPVDAVAVYASVANVSFRGVDYIRLVSKFSDITHGDPSVGLSFSNASLTFSNVTREIAALHFSSDLEGMFLVIRIISLSVSVNLDDSIIIFTGRCEKPGDSDKKQLPLSVTELLGTTQLEVPPRTFRHDDPNGLRREDKFSLGFPFMPKAWSVTYSTSEPKGGLVGNLFGLEKDVTKSFQASSHSALDVNRPVPLAFGFVQMRGNHIGYGDFGNSVAMLTVVCDGLSYGIHSYVSIRNIDPAFTGLQTAGFAQPPFNSPTGWLTYGLTAGTGTYPRAQLPVPAGSRADDIGNGHYNRSAFTYTFVNGSEVSEDDAAPALVYVINGLKVLTPDEDGIYNTPLFSDRGVDHARCIITDQYLMNLNGAFIDDEATVETRIYNDQILVDESNTDTLVLPESEEGKAGTDYHHYQSSGAVSPDYFKWIEGDDTVNAYGREATYIHAPIPPYENGEGGGIENPTNPDSPTVYRRRYTSNFTVTESMKAVDLLKNIVYPAYRGFHRYDYRGKLQLLGKRPVDNSLLRANTIVGATEIPVYSILAWRYSLAGEILIGAHLATSEVREVTGWRYTTAGNSITLSATGGGVTASGATFSGGNNTTTPATATLTVIDPTISATITIDGYASVLTPDADNDTASTFAALIAAYVNSHSVLGYYIKATHTPGEDIVYLESKLGFLQLSSALENTHSAGIASPVTAPTGASAGTGGNLSAGAWKVAYSYQTASGETRVSPSHTVTVLALGKVVTPVVTLPAGVIAVNWFLSRQEGSDRLKYAGTSNGASINLTDPPIQKARFAPSRNTTAEECMRVLASFTDRGLTQTNRTRANILADSQKWPLGSRQKSVNTIELAYFEKVDDWRPTELVVRDDEHIQRVGKPLPEKHNGRAIDNYHQAVRIANGLLAERRDADRFFEWSADGEAVLLNIGDVVCVTDYGSSFTNLPVRIEEKVFSWNGQLKVKFVGRFYATHLFSDEVAERTIPYPTSLNLPRLKTEKAIEVVVVDGENVLTTSQANASYIEFTGALTANAVVRFPDDVVRPWRLLNSTTGAFTLDVGTVSGGSTSELEQGTVKPAFGNGLDVILE